MQEIVPNISRSKIFVNRELSWMEFNLRVLSESLNPKIPLMERLKFLSIYFQNSRKSIDFFEKMSIRKIDNHLQRML